MDPRGERRKGGREGGKEMTCEVLGFKYHYLNE